MPLSMKSSVVALKKETTQNTVVVPNAAGDFIPILDGYNVSASFENLENKELKASIGKPKAVKGFEAPKASIPLYLKHSGTEGTAPNWGVLLESALGSVSTNSTERLTTTSSTTTLVKLAAGGTDFARGKAMLIKDSAMTGGYAIRNVTSMSTNDATLAQALASAPQTGMGVGKCVAYAVANNGHPSFTLWDYKANSGAIQMIGGCKCPSFTATMTAGQNIQGDFSVEGIEFFYNPMTTTSSNKWIDFKESGAELNCSIAEKTWKDPYDFAAAVSDAMNALAVANITVTYDDSSSKFTIKSDGLAFEILWKTGVHGEDNTKTSIATLAGYAVSGDDTGGLTYTSDTAKSWVAGYTPSYDVIDVNVAKNNEVLLGLSTEVTSFAAQEVSFDFGNDHQMLDNICAVSGRSGSTYTGRTVKVGIKAYLTAGQAKEFYRYRTNTAIVFTYNLGQKSGGNWVAGTCMNIHMPDAVISEFSLENSNGLVALNMSLEAFVGPSGYGEFYINFL